MLRLATLLAPLFLLGCASPRMSALVAGDEADLRVSAPSEAPPAVLDAPSGEEVPALEPATSEYEALLIDPRAIEPVLDDGTTDLHGSRITLKGGWWGGDEDELDDGYIFNLAWMRYFTSFFALEFEVGYMDVDGDELDTDLELWGIPLFVNGRLNAPLWILDVYGGAGVGTIYYDAEATSATLSEDDDGFLLAANVFLGATINLADALALGLEGKYYVTEDADDVDAGLDAFALMLTLGFGH